MDKRIGAQYYTIRDFCQTLDDFEKSCEKVSKIGYKTVQLSAIGDFDPNDIKTILDKNNLKAVCTHRPADNYLNNIEKEIEFHKIIGCDVAGLGAMPYGEATSGSVKRFIEEFSPVAERLGSEGLTFAYHNHCWEFMKEDGRFKMNPPLRDISDKEALLEGICDGTIDMIATDHAPHSADEKSKGLEKSLMGVVGLETAFPVLYTNLVKNGVISLERLIELMSTNPRKRFKISTDIGFSVFDVTNPYIINPNGFKTKGRATPFNGISVFGRCKATVYNQKVIYQY